MASSSRGRLISALDQDSPRLLSDVERFGGVGAVLVGAVFLAMWATGRGSDPHGDVWLLVPAQFLLPVGVLAAVAGLSLARRWRFSWLFQFLLVGYLIVLWFNPFVALDIVERLL